MYLPSVTWFYKLAPTVDVAAAMQRVLGRWPGTVRAPALYPPPAWDVHTEQKDAIFAQFRSHMLVDARWVDMDRASITAGRTVAALLAGQSDGKYYVKGATSYANICGAEVEVRGGACDALGAIVERFFAAKQRRVGIQPFVDGFAMEEYRHWCVRNGDADRYHCAYVMKTYLHGAEQTFAADLTSPMHEATVACMRRVSAMIADPACAAFWQRAHDLGIPAIRIDCGYRKVVDADTGAIVYRAFFNEFGTAPDASTFVEEHQHDIILLVANHFADAMWNTLYL